MFFANLDPLTPENFLRLFVNGWIVDGKGGGLVVGRRHDEGHIIMIEPSGELGEHTLAGYMEGGEYLMCKEATEVHMDRLHEINADNAPCDREIAVTPEHRIINTRGEPHDRILVISRQFIITREATKRHFEELNELNSKYAAHNGRLLSDGEVQELKELRFK